MMLKTKRNSPCIEVVGHDQGGSATILKSKGVGGPVAGKTDRALLTKSSDDMEGQLGKEESSALVELVSQLIGLGEEGCFRLVVRFL